MQKFLAVLLAFVSPLTMAGETVACRYSYGGETRLLVAQPVKSPYEVQAVPVGSYFLFRVVFQAEPIELKSVKIYTYADQDGGPVPIQQATYPFPLPGDGPFGFTGQQFVYEPMRDGELQYWCRLQTGNGAAG